MIVRLTKYIIVSATIVLIIFLSVMIYITIFGLSSKPVKSDVIIVLGTWAPKGVMPDSVLELRLRSALNLYRKGLASYIIVSGGHGNDEVWPEAEVMRDYLIDNGVDPLSIFIENKSFSTWENIKFSRTIMEEYHLKSAIVVSSFFHLARSKMIANRLGLENISFAKAVKAAKPSKTLSFVMIREVIAYIIYGLFYFEGGN